MSLSPIPPRLCQSPMPGLGPANSGPSRKQKQPRARFQPENTVVVETSSAVCRSSCADPFSELCPESARLNCRKQPDFDSYEFVRAGEPAVRGWPSCYGNFAYSALACFRMGMSGSHLSTNRKNPDTRRGPSQYRPAWHKPGPSPHAPPRQWDCSRPHLGSP